MPNQSEGKENVRSKPEPEWGTGQGSGKQEGAFGLRRERCLQGQRVGGRMEGSVMNQSGRILKRDGVVSGDRGTKNIEQTKK